MAAMSSLSPLVLYPPGAPILTVWRNSAAHDPPCKAINGAYIEAEEISATVMSNVNVTPNPMRLLFVISA